MKRYSIDSKNNSLVVSLQGIRPEILSKMKDSDKLRYVLSHLGIRQSVYSKKEVLRVPPSSTLSRGIDAKISHRRPNFYYDQFLNLFQIGEQDLAREVSYFGIEIECFIPFESLGVDRDDYRSSSTCECYECDGSGTVTYEHRNSGATTEGDCPICDGSGEIDNEDNDGETDESGLFKECRSKLGRLIKENKIKGVDAKHDGSLDPEDDELWAVEITILVPQNDFSNLEKLCKVLRDLEAVVNKTCGLHVHIDARKFSKEEAHLRGFNLATYLKFLKLMVPASRRENNYCKLRASKSDRYSAVNLTAYDRYKTIEIRLHSGTTDFQKISSWLSVLKTLWEKNETANHYRSTQKFLENFPPGLQTFIRHRISIFSGPDALNEESEDNETQTIAEAI